MRAYLLAFVLELPGFVRLRYDGCGRLSFIGCALVLTLAACTRTVTVTKPVPVEVVRNVVQPVPESLLQPHPIYEGGLAECPFVAAARAEQIKRCNADKAAIQSLSDDD